jgi:16S rRNA (cytosine1402-N4)-methyltransferase
VAEILEVLNPQPGEVAVDATLGYGGHATALLQKILPGGKLVGVDADPIEFPKTAERLITQFPSENLILKRTNFAALPKVLADAGIPGAHLILADLGVSSMQMDNPARGFSFKADGPLDLRMNPAKGQSAADFLKGVSQEKLQKILDENADEQFSELIAEAVVERRKSQPILRTLDLSALIQALLQRRRKADAEEIRNAIRRTFQALRIAVNEEFSVLETFLGHLPGLLLSGGRVAILTFHSGEDRRVKHAFRSGFEQGIFQEISEGVIRPGPDEIRENPRASSAKLRWARRA